MVTGGGPGASGVGDDHGRVDGLPAQLVGGASWRWTLATPSCPAMGAGFTAWPASTRAACASAWRSSRASAEEASVVAGWIPGRGASLLEHVRQLVGQEPLPLPVGRPIAAGGEEDVPADGVGEGVQAAGGRGRVGVRVDADVGEAGRERRLREGTDPGTEGLAEARGPPRRLREAAVAGRALRAFRTRVPVAAALDQLLGGAVPDGALQAREGPGGAVGGAGRARDRPGTWAPRCLPCPAHGVVACHVSIRCAGPAVRAGSPERGERRDAVGRAPAPSLVARGAHGRGGGKVRHQTRLGLTARALHERAAGHGA